MTSHGQSTCFPHQPDAKLAELRCRHVRRNDLQSHQSLREPVECLEHHSPRPSAEVAS
jgi:hypothetical protein